VQYFFNFNGQEYLDKVNFYGFNVHFQ
jgi:hypothetical protein